MASWIPVAHLPWLTGFSFLKKVGLKPVIQILREPPETNEMTEINGIQWKETKNRKPGAFPAESTLIIPQRSGLYRGK